MNFSRHSALLWAKIIIYCWLLIPVVCVAAWAGANEVFIKTRYENGAFDTEAYIVPEAPPELMYEVVSDIDSLLRRLDIDALMWALKGLAGKEEGKNLIQIEYKGGNYDPDTNVFDFFLELYAGSMKRQFKNIRITVLMTSERDGNGDPVIAAELCNPNFFLKSAGGTMSIRQKGGKREFAVQVSVRFAWFFNLFITTSNYCAIAEWRIGAFLENMKDETARRERARG